MAQLNLDFTITDQHVAAAANIAATKVQQQYVRGYSQPNTTATTETRNAHIVHGATGSLVAFRAGSIVANIGAATVTLDLKKNNVSVLSAVITLDNGNTARIGEAATLSSTSLVAGDWLEVVITATAGGGTLATGVFCELIWREDAA